MTHTVGAYEAKTHLSHLLDKVGEGDTVIITKHGVAVAQLIPTEPKTKMSHAEAIEALRNFKPKVTLGNITIRELIDEGKRY